ncbi:unnamed protein product [Arabidopsis halleri]
MRRRVVKPTMTRFLSFLLIRFLKFFKREGDESEVLKETDRGIERGKSKEDQMDVIHAYSHLSISHFLPLLTYAKQSHLW